MRAKIAVVLFGFIFSSYANAVLVNPPSSPIAGVSTTDVRMIDAPAADITFSLYENNDTAFLWQERTRTVSSQDVSLLVSELAAGEITKTAKGPSGVLGAGTYDSYFLHMDPDVPNLGGPAGKIFSGSITFSQEIAGLIYNRFENCASHDVFGALVTTYPGAGYPGPDVTCNEIQNFDFARVNDNWITLSADRKTLTFSQYAAHDMDQIRILTSVVPIPAAVWLFGSGLSLLGWFGHRGAAKA